MANILIYDGVCPKGYTLETLETEAMGGTEATVLRVAAGLATNGHYVTIAQRNRETTEIADHEGKLSYVPNYIIPDENYDVVITLRDAGHYNIMKGYYKNAKHYLWIHDYVSGEYRQHLYIHLRDSNGAHVVAVSDHHKHNFTQQLMDIVVSREIKVTRVYNPLAEYCVKKNVVVDKNKLVFFSSPHKGGDYMFKLFEMINRIDPEMKLVVGNPGYLPYDVEFTNKNITILGYLPHRQMINHVRSALCLFYPNYVFPETFGLVMAEANAVGVPVLTHPLAAANEILGHPKERMDVRDYKAVVDRVLAWKAGDRPTVKANPQFKLDIVIREWSKLL